MKQHVIEATGVGASELKCIDERWLYARKVAFTTMVAYITWQTLTILQEVIMKLV